MSRYARIRCAVSQICDHRSDG